MTNTFRAIASVPAMLTLCACSALTAGCGGAPVDPGAPATPAPPPETGTKIPGESATPPKPVVDHGAPSETFPAFKPDVGQLVNNGGDILASPVIITVTFPDEKNAAQFEAFGDGIGSSEYWKSVTSEYGVGPAVSGEANHVRVASALPAEIADVDLDAFVAESVGNVATSKWPAPTKDAVYILYLPKTTTLTMYGKSVCLQGVGGYHTSTEVAGNQVAYAIIPQCSFGGGGSGSSIRTQTLSASHELAEAATDAHPMSLPAWYGYDEEHAAWDIFQDFQVENGDMCEFYRESSYRETEASFSFTVQRQWSNASAAAGHHPCVPAPNEPFFNVTPLGAQTVVVNLARYGGSSKAKTKGYMIKVGEEGKIPLGFYSDAATGPWTVEAVEGNPLVPRDLDAPDPPSTLAISIDGDEGQNGNKAEATVKVLASSPTKAHLVTFISTLGQTRHYMPVLVASE